MTIEIYSLEEKFLATGETEATNITANPMTVTGIAAAVHLPRTLKKGDIAQIREKGKTQFRMVKVTEYKTPLEDLLIFGSLNTQ